MLMSVHWKIHSMLKLMFVSTEFQQRAKIDRFQKARFFTFPSKINLLLKAIQVTIRRYLLTAFSFFGQSLIIFVVPSIFKQVRNEKKN